MVSNFSHLSEHILLCGDNVLTRELASHYIRQGKVCFFLEHEVTRAAILEADGFNVVHINPENPAELSSVNLHKAVSLVSAYDDDARNILVMMTAQSLQDEIKNPTLALVARIEQLHNIEKAKRAGATKVISPLKESAAGLLGSA